MTVAFQLFCGVGSCPVLCCIHNKDGVTSPFYGSTQSAECKLWLLSLKAGAYSYSQVSDTTVSTFDAVSSKQTELRTNERRKYNDLSVRQLSSSQSLIWNRK